MAFAGITFSMLNVYEQIDRNRRKSLLVITAFFCFIIFVVWVFGKTTGEGYYWLGPGLIIASLTSLGGYFWSDKIILTISRARQANRQQDFHFYTVAENLSMAAQIPTPKLYVIEDSAPNAFACGRDENHASVCTTTGLLEKLDRSELEGVIAHELSHIKNYDMRLMTVVAIFVGLIGLLADWFYRGRFFLGSGREKGRSQIQGLFFLIALLLAALAPLVANLIKLAISRRREFLADAGSAMLTRQPQALARALEKIAHDHEPLEVASAATAHLYIINPLKGHQWMGKLASLFNTHPPVEERIRALNQMV